MPTALNRVSVVLQPPDSLALETREGIGSDVQNVWSFRLPEGSAAGRWRVVRAEVRTTREQCPMGGLDSYITWITTTGGSFYVRNDSL